MSLKQIWIHTYLREDGERVPYRVSAEEERLSPYHPDDRIETGYFISLERYQQLIGAVVEAASGTSAPVRKDAFRAGFQGALERAFRNADGDPLEADEWEAAYELWREAVRNGR